MTYGTGHLLFYFQFSYGSLNFLSVLTLFAYNPKMLSYAFELLLQIQYNILNIVYVVTIFSCYFTCSQQKRREAISYFLLYSFIASVFSSLSVIQQLFPNNPLIVPDTVHCLLKHISSSCMVQSFLSSCVTHKNFLGG